MTPRRWSKSMTTLALAAICVALAWKVYDEARRLRQPVALDGPAADAEEAPASPSLGTSLTVPGQDDFAAIVERPLFSPSRRPAQAAPVPMPESSDAPPAEVLLDFALIGTIVSGGDRVALVEMTSDGKIVQVRERGEVSGWTASLIEDGRVVFRRGNAKEELVLKYELPVPPGKVVPRRQPVRETEPAVQADEGAQPESNVPPPVDAPAPAVPPQLIERAPRQ